MPCHITALPSLRHHRPFLPLSSSFSSSLSSLFSLPPSPHHLSPPSSRRSPPPSHRNSPRSSHHHGPYSTFKVLPRCHHPTANSVAVLPCHVTSPFSPPSVVVVLLLPLTIAVTPLPPALLLLARSPLFFPFK